jgi:hypothetical protein
LNVKGDNMNALGNVVESSKAGLMSPEFYSGVAGIAVGGVLGSALTLLPFQRAGMFGNTLRTVVTLGSGAYLVNKSRSQSGDMGRLYLGAGTILGFAGVSQVLGYLTAMTGLSIPGFNGLGTMITAGAESDDSQLIAQRGSGSVIGQETATQSFSDIYSADTFEEGTQEMVNRVPAGNPVDSIYEDAPLGHGVRQWFGADEDMEIAPSGGLDQNLGGASAEPTTVAMPQEQLLGDFVNSVDTLGLRAMNPLGRANAFVDSKYPGGDPPVSYGAEEPMLNVEYPSPTPMMGSLPDMLNTYIKPSTTAEQSVMDSVRVINPGQPIQWFGAENGKMAGTVTHSLTSAEGFGSVIGQ